jgi:HlyD family secretion protein
MKPALKTSQRRSQCLLWAIGLIIVCAGIAGAAAVHRMQWERGITAGSARLDTPVVARRVHALGRLEPAGTVLKIAPPSGNEGTRVEQLLVREGDDVAAGDVLAVLDNASQREAAVLEAEARLGVMQARLEQVQAGAKTGDIAAQQLAVDLQAEQLKVAERELKRARDLHGKNVLTTEDLDNKQWIVDRVSLEHRRANELLNSLREVRAIDVRVAERDVTAAEAAWQRAKVDFDRSRVRASSSGRILKIHTQAGEKIGDQGLLELGDVLHMEAVAEVFEADVADIRIGQPAIVQVESLTGALTGTVSEIGHRVARKVVLTNDPVSDTDARVVEVRIRLAPDAVDRVVRLSNARVEVQITLTADHDAAKD